MRRQLECAAWVHGDRGAMFGAKLIGAVAALSSTRVGTLKITVIAIATNNSLSTGTTMTCTYTYLSYLRPSKPHFHVYHRVYAILRIESLDALGLRYTPPSPMRTFTQ